MKTSRKPARARLASLAGVLLFFSCSTNIPPTPPPSVTPYKILFLSQQFRYNDMGFVRTDENGVWLEIYALGKPLYKVNIKPYQVCLADCYPKNLFIQHVFGDFAPSSILEDILLKRDIYGGENLVIDGETTTQTIERNGSSIVYTRSAEKTSFVDSIRRIKIILEHVQ